MKRVNYSSASFVVDHGGFDRLCRLCRTICSSDRGLGGATEHRTARRARKASALRSRRFHLLHTNYSNNERSHRDNYNGDSVSLLPRFVFLSREKFPPTIVSCLLPCASLSFAIIFFLFLFYCSLTASFSFFR